jgi:hypothetical protein
MTILKEKIPAEAVKRIVQNYAADPTGHAGKPWPGLLALMLSSAEWGVEVKYYPPIQKAKTGRVTLMEATGERKS